jgi:hypothetical protein
VNVLWVIAIGILCGAIFLVGMYLQWRIFRNAGIIISFKSLGFWDIVGYVSGVYFFRLLNPETLEKVGVQLGTMWAYRNRRALKTLVVIPSLAALAILVLVFLGATTSYVLGSFDEKITEPLFDYQKTLISTLVLCLAFVAKSVFGMTVTTVSLTWFMWNYLVHGDYSLSPIFTVTMDLVMDSMPIWVIWLYALVTLLYSLASSIWLSVHE